MNKFILKIIFLSLFLFLVMTRFGNAQSSLCNGSVPFCTAEGFTYSASINAGGAEDGPWYQCLSYEIPPGPPWQAPNPAWFHMRIADPGDLTYSKYQVTPNWTLILCVGGHFKILYCHVVAA